MHEEAAPAVPYNTYKLQLRCGTEEGRSGGEWSAVKAAMVSAAPFPLVLALPEWAGSPDVPSGKALILPGRAAPDREAAASWIPSAAITPLCRRVHAPSLKLDGVTQ
jgi:hypothetical protein